MLTSLKLASAQNPFEIDSKFCSGWVGLAQIFTSRGEWSMKEKELHCNVCLTNKDMYSSLHKICNFWSIIHYVVHVQMGRQECMLSCGLLLPNNPALQIFKACKHMCIFKTYKQLQATQDNFKNCRFCTNHYMVTFRCGAMLLRGRGTLQQWESLFCIFRCWKHLAQNLCHFWSASIACKSNVSWTILTGILIL